MPDIFAAPTLLCALMCATARAVRQVGQRQAGNKPSAFRIKDFDSFSFLLSCRQIHMIENMRRSTQTLHLIMNLHS